MKLTSIMLAAGMGLAGLGVAVARNHDDHGKSQENVRLIKVYDMTEKLDGKEAKATAVEVSFEPGQAGSPHHHPGPALGYVLEGEYEWAIDDQPVKVLKAGDTFYEPGGCLHRVSRGAGKSRTRVIAWVVHPRDAKDLVIPVDAKKK